MVRSCVHGSIRIISNYCPVYSTCNRFRLGVGRFVWDASIQVQFQVCSSSIPIVAERTTLQAISKFSKATNKLKVVLGTNSEAVFAVRDTYRPRHPSRLITNIDTITVCVCVCLLYSVQLGDTITVERSNGRNSRLPPATSKSDSSFPFTRVWPKPG